MYQYKTFKSTPFFKCVNNITYSRNSVTPGRGARYTFVPVIVHSLTHLLIMMKTIALLNNLNQIKLQSWEIYFTSSQ